MQKRASLRTIRFGKTGESSIKLNNIIESQRTRETRLLKDTHRKVSPRGVCTEALGCYDGKV